MKLIILAPLLLASTAYAAVYAVPKGQGVNTGSADVPIVKYNNEGVNPDGSYQWSYETGNGIAAQEQGGMKDPETMSAHGEYHFKTPEGLDVSITYIADENGFQPQGDVIPVAPPIPDAILRSLKWNEEHPEPAVGY